MPINLQLARFTMGSMSLTGTMVRWYGATPPEEEGALKGSQQEAARCRLGRQTYLSMRPQSHRTA